MPLWYLNFRGSLLLLQSSLAVMLFGYSLNRRSHFKLRAFVGLVFGCGIAHLAGRLLYIPGSAPLALLSHVLMPLLTFCVLIGIVYLCLDENIWTALFVASSGYIAQDMAGSVKQIVKQIPFSANLAAQDFGVLLVDLFCYGSVFTLLFFFFRPYTRNREDNFDSKLKAVMSVAVLVLCIGMARLTQDNPARNATAAVAESIYAIIVDALMLLLQFGIMERARLNNRVEALRELIHQQYMQYEASKESVELINEKYHDLKHMMNSIQDIVPGSKLQEIRQSIERYDVRVTTGYKVLDVLLTQKMDLCLQRGISMTVNLGRTDFSFMDKMDLYALFQNALNNAINAVSSLPSGKPRYIIVAAAQEGNIITVHVENSCEEGVVFADGLPQTEGDTRYHGFGMKSMVRTAEAYGGMLVAKQEGERFYLDILMLRPE